uniref:Astrotactin-1/2 Fn3 domain-containing protein n=1 Tax=Pseudonaja textilis TaxID=8673 RepID=A0A670ZBB5_PSETE
MPFITYLSGLLTAQMLSDDQMVSGVEIHCEEKGRCPSTCHLCHWAGKEQLSPTPVLLEINHIIPLYMLIQDNETREAFKGALMSSYWCSGKGDVIEDWCRCDLNAFDENGLPSCSALPQPVLRLSPNVEPSSTVVSLEWYDVQPAIGTKVSDYILHHKKTLASVYGTPYLSVLLCGATKEDPADQLGLNERWRIDGGRASRRWHLPSEDAREEEEGQRKTYVPRFKAQG